MTTQRGHFERPTCTRLVSSWNEDEDVSACGRLATVEALTTAGQWEPHCGWHVVGWPADRVRESAVGEDEREDVAANEGAMCCTYRDHFGEDAVCACPDHPQSYLHPHGAQAWPAL